MEILAPLAPNMGPSNTFRGSRPLPAKWDWLRDLMYRVKLHPLFHLNGLSSAQAEPLFPVPRLVDFDGCLRFSLVL